MQKVSMSSLHQSETNQPLPIELFSEKNKAYRPPTVCIKKSPEEIFNFIRNPLNMPIYIKNLQMITEQNDSTWIWTFENDGEPQDMKSEIVSDKKNEVIAWRLVNADGESETGGFALREDPSGRGTLVSFKLGTLERDPNKVTGVLSQLVLGGNAKSDSFTSLRRLKAYLETGEVPTTKGQPNGKDEDMH